MSFIFLFFLFTKLSNNGISTKYKWRFFTSTPQKRRLRPCFCAYFWGGQSGVGGRGKRGHQPLGFLQISTGSTIIDERGFVMRACEPLLCERVGDCQQRPPLRFQETRDAGNRFQWVQIVWKHIFMRSPYSVTLRCQ